MKTFPYPFLILILFPLSSYYIKEDPASVSAKLVFPVTGDKNHIGSFWGDERDGGKRKHEGIDIFAGKGNPVVSVTNGWVTEISEDEIGGKNITIQSDNYEWRTYYAHLNEFKVVKGQEVKKGQLIGTVGNTGNAKTTSPHLHFGIYTENGAVDPLPYVKSSPHITTPVAAGKVVYREKQSDPVIVKSASKKIRFPAEIKTAAVNIITGVLVKKIGGLLK